MRLGDIEDAVADDDELFEWTGNGWKPIVATAAAEETTKNGIVSSPIISKSKKRSSSPASTSHPSKAVKVNDNNNDNKKPEKKVRKNTSVFVSNLPDDVTVPELASYFSKCGIIMEDLQAAVAAKYANLAQKINSSGTVASDAAMPKNEPTPKIKLYRDKEGNFKGEALIVFYKEESVALAVDLLDDSELRPGHPRISVQAAVFQESSCNDASLARSSGSSKLSREERLLLRNKFQNMEKYDFKRKDIAYI